MSDAGYVRIFRSLIGHPAFRNDAEAMAFAWMVIRAAWRPVRVRYKERMINLERGQLAISVRDMAAALDRDKAWIERLWKRLKSETMVTTCNETGVSIVTICNYAEYQGEQDTGETPRKTRHETGARQGRDTEQRREEGKKEEEDASASLAREHVDELPVDLPAKPKRKAPAKRSAGTDHHLPADWQPILTEAAQAVVDGWPPGMFEQQVAAFRDHAADKGRVSKDWQAAFRTWINRTKIWTPANDRSTPYRSMPAQPVRKTALRRAIETGLENLDWLGGGRT